MDWEYEPVVFPVHYERDGVIVSDTYTPDFKTAFGWYEVKGRWTSEGEGKYKSFQIAYPDEKISTIERNELRQMGVFQTYKKLFPRYNTEERPMFRGAPENVHLPEGWREYLEDTRK